MREFHTTDKCPWFAISMCPLYVASHAGYGDGCIDDIARPCSVRRGVTNYFDAVGVLIANRFGVPAAHRGVDDG